MAARSYEKREAVANPGGFRFKSLGGCFKRLNVIILQLKLIRLHLSET